MVQRAWRGDGEALQVYGGVRHRCCRHTPSLPLNESEVLCCFASPALSPATAPPPSSLFSSARGLFIQFRRRRAVHYACVREIQE